MTSNRLETKNLNTLYGDIKELDKFKPSPEVNKLFSSLVTGIIEDRFEESLSEDEMKELRSLCGQSEFQLEKYWNDRIVNSENPVKEMKCFPYYSNYEKLVAFEYATLVGCCNNLEKTAVFVGGGPLPFSAFILAEKYGFDVTIIDRDAEAVEKAKTLSRILGISVKAIQAKAEEFKDYNNYSVVHVAAMVGETKKEELDVFNSINKQIDSHSHVVARTVHGKRKLLYRPISDEVKNMFNVEAEKRPSNDIINSTVVMTASGD